MAGSFNVSAKLLLGTANGTPGTAMDFISETLSRKRPIVNTNGMTGTRSDFAARSVGSVTPVDGHLACRPNVVEMQNLLPWTLGGTPSGTSYPLAEFLTTQSYWALRNVTPSDAGKVYKYPVVGVSRGEFGSEQGGPLSVGLDLVGALGSGGYVEDSATAGGSFPAYSLDNATGPWMHHMLVLTIGGTPYLCRNFHLSVDNGIDSGRFYNSQYLQTVQPTHRVVSVSAQLPFGDAAAAYATSQAGVAVTAVYTNGVKILTFSMPAVQFEDPTPTAADRSQEMMLDLNGVARATSAAGNELAVTLAVS